MAPNVGHAMTQDPDGRHPEDHCTILHTYCYDRRNKEPTYRSRHGKATVFVSSSARDEATEKRELLPTFTPDLDGPSSPCQMMKGNKEEPQ
jgi:hypothetical protein